MDFGKDKGYRPQIVVAGSDSLEKAAKQAQADQQLEAAIDTRNGERREEIYGAAQKFIEATEVLGIKRRKSVEERQLDTDRIATGLAFGLNAADERAKITGITNALNLLLPRVTNGTRRKVYEGVAKAFYEIHGLQYPPKKQS